MPVLQTKREQRGVESGIQELPSQNEKQADKVVEASSSNENDSIAKYAASDRDVEALGADVDADGSPRSSIAPRRHDDPPRPPQRRPSVQGLGLLRRRSAWSGPARGGEGWVGCRA